MVVPTEETAPKIEDIVTDIQALTEAIKLVDQKLAMLATVTHDALEGIKGRIQKLEKRHTAHLHWTNMGR